MEDITDKITDCILNKIPISFSKYGDGEYNCANNYFGYNCDNDSYTEKLGNAIRNSFIYMTTNEYASNNYIGVWHNYENTGFWKSLVNNNINWSNYHTILIDDLKGDSFQRKLNMYKAIQETPLKKYVICNSLLIKSKILLNATSLIHVPLRNWFDNYFDELIKIVCQEIGEDEQPIVITACGMGAKVVIAELHKKYPRGIFLDFGSAMDLICTKRDSRGRGYSYEELYNSLFSILPNDWHDPKYEAIYLDAQQNLGIHL